MNSLRLKVPQGVTAQISQTKCLRRGESGWMRFSTANTPIDSLEFIIAYQDFRKTPHKIRFRCIPHSSTLEVLSTTWSFITVTSSFKFWVHCRDVTIVFTKNEMVVGMSYWEKTWVTILSGYRNSIFHSIKNEPPGIRPSPFVRTGDTYPPCFILWRMGVQMQWQESKEPFHSTSPVKKMAGKRAWEQCSKLALRTSVLSLSKLL